VYSSPPASAPAIAGAIAAQQISAAMAARVMKM
jgi:hypothetical protein